MTLPIDRASEAAGNEEKCVLGFRQLRGPNWEARPLEDCSKPQSWVKLYEYARARGVKLLPREHDMAPGKG